MLFAPDAAHLGPGVALNHLISENLGLLFRFGHYQASEQRAASPFERPATHHSHDLWMIVVLAKMP